MKTIPAPRRRAIFFDAGLTLLSPKPSLPLMCHALCAEYGLAVDLDHIHYAVQQATEWYRRYNQLQRPWEQEETIHTMWTHYYTHLFSSFLAHHNRDIFDQLAQRLYHSRELPASWQPYPDVIPVLRALKAQGYIVGVISDWGYSLDTILLQHGLTPYLDCLVTSARTHCAKPSPAIFEVALQRTSTNPDEAVYVGDSYIHDIIGARAAQLLPVLLDRSQKLRTVRMDCQVIDSLDALLEGGKREVFGITYQTRSQ